LSGVSGWLDCVCAFLISEDTGRLLYQGHTVQWRDYLVVWLTTAYAWALLAPFVWRLARRFSIEQRIRWRSIGLHLVLSIGLAVIEAALFALITPVFGLPWFSRNFAATFRAVLPIDFHLNVIIYWMIVGVQHSVSCYRRFS